jgi:PQQ-dependent dehydrogenase (methanol/ethanol family)
MSGLALLALAACGEAKLSSITAAQVDGQAIIDADKRPEIWISHGRTYSEQRYSPLKQINAETVKDVGIAWTATLDTNRGMEATPIVVDGVMYLTSAWSVVYAYDAKTGERLWKFDPKVDKSRGVSACCDVVNRGVAIWEGMVYVGTIDGRLIALDASRTEGVTEEGGEKVKTPVWDEITVDQSKPYTITGAPRVIKGKVIIGNGGAEFGVRGYISAYDAKTGKMAWRFLHDTQSDEAGRQRRLRQDLRREGQRVMGRQRRVDRNSAVAARLWDAMAYDPELDMLYRRHRQRHAVESQK